MMKLLLALTLVAVAVVGTSTEVHASEFTDFIENNVTDSLFPIKASVDAQSTDFTLFLPANAVLQGILDAESTQVLGAILSNHVVQGAPGDFETGDLLTTLRPLSNKDGSEQSGGSLKLKVLGTPPGAVVIQHADPTNARTIATNDVETFATGSSGTIHVIQLPIDDPTDVQTNILGVPDVISAVQEGGSEGLQAALNENAETVSAIEGLAGLTFFLPSDEALEEFIGDDSTSTDEKIAILMKHFLVTAKDENDIKQAAEANDGAGTSFANANEGTTLISLGENNATVVGADTDYPATVTYPTAVITYQGTVHQIDGVIGYNFVPPDGDEEDSASQLSVGIMAFVATSLAAVLA